MDTEGALSSSDGITEQETKDNSPVIEMATPDLILKYLPEDAHGMKFVSPYQSMNPDWVDANHPLGQSTLATDPEHPAILFESAAGPCSPVLAFDEAGSALHAHNASAAFGDFRPLDEYYFPTLPDRLKGGKVSFVMGGTNLPVSEESKAPDVVNPIDSTAKGFQERIRSKFPDSDFYTLVSKQHANQRATHPVIPENATIRGFVFIPRYIAKDQRNHVLVVADNGDEIHRELINATRIR